MKKGAKKKKYIIALIMIIIFVFLKYIYNSPQKQLALSEQDVYNENWELEGVYIGGYSPSYMTFADKSTLTIVLTEKNVPRYLDTDNVSDIFWTFKDVFLVDHKELYGDYVLNVEFYDEMSQLCSIYYYGGKVYIENNGWLIGCIDDIAEKFPEMTCISTDILRYRDLNSIKRLYNLEYLSVGSIISEEDFNTYMKAETKEKFVQAHDELSFSDEERDIILSYFPDCLIE